MSTSTNARAGAPPPRMLTGAVGSLPRASLSGAAAALLAARRTSTMIQQSSPTTPAPPTGIPAAGRRRSSSSSGASALHPRILDAVASRPTYDVGEPGVNVNLEMRMVDTDLADLRAAILKLERDVKETFVARRVATGAAALFPDAAALGGGAGGGGGAALGNAAYATASTGGGGGGGSAAGNEYFDDLVLRAKMELALFKEAQAKEAEERARAREAHARKVEAEIQATREMFAENAALTLAGPKHQAHFLSFLGDVMHIEMLSPTMVIVFTSRGYLEIWKYEGIAGWKLADHWPLAPHFPRITSVCPLAPTRQEQAHLQQNRMHYLNVHQHPTTVPAAASATATAPVTTGDDSRPSAVLFNLPPDKKPVDELVERLTSATYDMGGILDVSDDQRQRTLHFYTYLTAWIAGKASTVGTAVLERPLFLVGCANGEASIVELTIAEERGANDKTVRHRILDRAMVSQKPIVHAAYFAPGHHVVVVVHNRDRAGRLVPDLVAYAVPRFVPMWTRPVAAIHAAAVTLAGCAPADADAAAASTDSWTHDGANGIPRLSALAADNVHLRLYVGLGDLVVQLAYAQLPVITEATFFNQEGIDDDVEVMANDDHDDKVLVVINAVSLNLQEREDRDRARDEAGSDDDAVSDAGTSMSASARTLDLGAGKNVSIEVSSITPFTNALTFKPYLLVGCYNASVRCLNADTSASGSGALTEEVFYYSSDMSARGARTGVATGVLAPSRDVHLCLTAAADGTLTVLSMDRRALLHEHRLLACRAAKTVAPLPARGNVAVSGALLHVPSAAAAGGEVGNSTHRLAAPGGFAPLSSTANLHEGTGGEQGGGIMRVGAGVLDRRLLFVADPDMHAYAVASGNEWTLLRATDLVRWLEAHPAMPGEAKLEGVLARGLQANAAVGMGAGAAGTGGAGV
ncbi:hypothetical protein GGF32_004900 [Allomyces javanicus]|nr:hypothetical protein GGF32_004900 [Allomyces javanicus]